MAQPKVWLITGASSGFGRVMTEYVLAKGDIAVATCRKPEVLSALTKAHPSSKLLVLKLDVTKPDEITKVFAEIKTKIGRIDIVFNNAGYGNLSEIEFTPDEVARGVFEVNFWGSANVARAAVKFFREVNPAGAGGHLLTVTSVAGFEGNPALGYYAASKFATEGLQEALSKELLPAWNIKITIIEPGGFTTRGTQPESLVTVPQSEIYKDGISTMIRNFVNTATLPGDTQKAVREMYKIGNTRDVPLRIPLGNDSLQTLQGVIKNRQEIVEKTAIYSEDLLAAAT